MWKLCSKCKRHKPLYAFSRNKYGKFGVQSVCKSCISLYQKEWFFENRDNKLLKNNIWNNNHDRTTYNNAYNKLWAKKNPDKKNVIRARYRTKKANASVELTEEEKIKIEAIYSKCNSLGKDYQVDHIIPISKGGLHHPDNLQIIPTRENRKKYNNVDYVIDVNLIIKLEGG